MSKVSESARRKWFLMIEEVLGAVAASASMLCALSGRGCDSGYSADFCVSMGGWNCPPASMPHALRMSLVSLFVVTWSYR